MTGTNENHEIESSTETAVSRAGTGDGEPTKAGPDSGKSGREQPTADGEGPGESMTDRPGADTRRRFLLAVSAASAAALAGCPGSSDAGETDADTGTPDPTTRPPTSAAPPTATAAPTETGTPEVTETATDTATATPEPVDPVVLPAAAQEELALAGGFEQISIDGGDEGGA